ncbi:MAG: hypothetical protein DMG53_11330 [Acidobacteria bacterium]|nr:MAG: hypothetical protein DMG53_11330 [Acidobacteriota bacterium]
MLVIAHRGASGNAPENTMAAFKKAVALGANFIETDLQLSRDARLVAIHDATVNRTTNGQGTVHDMTLTELRRLDAGSWFGSEFAGERIPTLEEILEFSKKNDVVFYLEKAVAIGARQLAVRGDLVTPALIAEARRKDLQVVCWTVNHPAHMRLLAAAGVDGIMSDYPDRLVAAVRKEAESIP